MTGSLDSASITHQIAGMSTKRADSSEPKSTRRSPKGERTRTDILDAAEELFGLAPYETVFQRDIATRAGVLIGVLTHHYPTKVSLFDAVVGRRAADLNEERLQRLQALSAPDIDAVLNAFFEPFIRRASGDDRGWLAYFRMMQRFGFVGDGVLIHSKYFKDTVHVFAQALARAIPFCNPVQLQLCFSCAIDLVLTAAFQPDRFETVFGPDSFRHLSEGAAVRQRYNHIRPFISGGFGAITG